MEYFINHIKYIQNKKLGKRKMGKRIGLFIGIFLPLNSFGQAIATEGSNDQFILLALVGFVFFVMLLTLLVAVYTLVILKRIIKNESNVSTIKSTEGSWWQKISRKLTKAVPIEKEEAVLLSHDFDGIQELDNHLPPWWTWLFYFTIIFAFAYLRIYHVWNAAPLQKEEYQNQLAAAASKIAESSSSDDGSEITSDNVTLSDDVAILDMGSQIYSANCVPCHGPDAGGLPNLGPNLTDEYWLHGGGIKNVFNVIQNGVQGTGMIPWKTQMSAENIQAVGSFVLSLQGSNPTNAQPPQGEIYHPEVESSETPVQDDATALDDSLSVDNQ